MLYRGHHHMKNMSV